MTDIAHRLLHIAVALSPEPYRQTRREQWLADVRDARELQMSPAHVAVGALTTALLNRRLRHRSSWGETLIASTAPTQHTVRTSPLLVGIGFISAVFGTILLFMTSRYQGTPEGHLVFLMALGLIVVVPTLTAVIVIALTRQAAPRRRVFAAVIAVVGLALYFWGLLGASPSWLWEALGMGASTMAWLFLLNRPRWEWFSILVPVAVAIGAGAIITVVPALYTLSTPVAGLTAWLVQFLAPLALVGIGAFIARRARLVRGTADV